MRHSKMWTGTGIAMVLAAITAMLITFPQPSLTAALRGVSIWWDVLFPALLPFFIISELLLGFGIVHFFGTLLDPLMRPLFRVPGIGGFAMALGFASGYPVGARLVSQLWEQRLLTRVQGERLVAFITTSDPIFLIGAVSVGFFHDASLAVVLGISHYGSAVLVGLGMRFYRRNDAEETDAEKHMDAALPRKPSASVWIRAFEAMHSARVKDRRPIGTLLSQAVGNALQLNFVVGGLVVFFSVILELLTSGGVMGALHGGIGSALQLIGLPQSLSQAVINGLFEVTLGAKASAADAGLPLVSKAAIAAFVLSWAGLSVHAQIVSLLSRTSLRYAPFLAARFAHGILAAVAVMLLWTPLQPLRGSAAAAVTAIADGGPVRASWTWALPAGVLLFAGMLAFLAASALLIAAVAFMRRLTAGHPR